MRYVYKCVYSTRSRERGVHSPIRCEDNLAIYTTRQRYNILVYTIARYYRADRNEKSIPRVLRKYRIYCAWNIFYQLTRETRVWYIIFFFRLIDITIKQHTCTNYTNDTNFRSDSKLPRKKEEIYLLSQRQTEAKEESKLHNVKAKNQWEAHTRRIYVPIEKSVYTYHLLRSKLSHSAVSSLYSARLLRNLANSWCSSVWRSRDTLALITVAASTSTRTSQASDNPAAPIIQVIASASPRYRAVRIASASLCKADDISSDARIHARMQFTCIK